MSENKNQKSEKFVSLQTKVFRAVLLISVMVGVVSLIVGLTIYTFGMIEQYISQSFGLCIATSKVIRNSIDIDKVSDSVMDIYGCLSEEERKLNRTDEYVNLFRDVYTDEYFRLYDILDSANSNYDISDIYIGVFDEETKALVYICDPDKRSEYVNRVGEYDAVDPEVYRKFTAWDGSGSLYNISNTPRYGLVCTTGFPLNYTGDQSMFIMVDITLSKLLHGMRDFIIRLTLILGVFVVILGAFLSRRLSRRLIHPINQIAEAARTYVIDKKGGLARTDHFSSLDIHTGDEIENLSGVMADMEQGLSEYEQDLTRITAETERFNVQLSLAEKIQADMLPTNFEEINSRNEFTLYALMDPAMEVGGDFYDFYMLDDDHLVITIADVSGKGFAAALFMMASMIKLEDYVRLGKPLSEVMATANNELCGNDDEERMFVTVWIAVLEIPTGILKAVNAGHEYPAIRKPGGQFELFKDTHGFVVGGLENMKYKEYELKLEPDTTIFVYTDGVPESTNIQGELFGTNRMLEVLNQDPDAEPDQILDRMFTVTDSYAGSSQFDDLTMLCIRYYGPGHRKEKKDAE